MLTPAAPSEVGQKGLSIQVYMRQDGDHHCSGEANMDIFPGMVIRNQRHHAGNYGEGKEHIQGD
jgi:hypothetical protein